MHIIWNWDISVGTILTGAGLGIAVWQSHRSTVQKTEEMHRENLERITRTETMVEMIYEWWQKRQSGD